MSVVPGRPTSDRGPLMPAAFERLTGPVPEEPRPRGTKVRDRDGDIWKKGNTRWTCQAPVDGVRVHAVGRMVWSDLWRTYGPLVEVR